MKRTIRDAMIGISLGMNVLLAGALLYDYLANNSSYTIGILVAYFVFNLVLLFMWAMGRREETESDVLTRYVIEGRLPGSPPAIAAPPVTVPSKPVAPPFKSPGALGPFTFKGYTLYTRKVALKGGTGERSIYFFAKKNPKSGHAAPKPVGFHVGVNERTGLPFLKKGAGKDGEDLTPEAEHHYRPQCAALTEEDMQCRNSAREGSKYCASHFGYQPPVLAKAEVARDDTLPHVRNAKDTKPSARKRAVA